MRRPKTTIMKRHRGNEWDLENGSGSQHRGKTSGWSFCFQSPDPCVHTGHGGSHGKDSSNSRMPNGISILGGYRCCLFGVRALLSSLGRSKHGRSHLERILKWKILPVYDAGNVDFSMAWWEWFMGLGPDSNRLPCKCGHGGDDGSVRMWMGRDEQMKYNTSHFLDKLIHTRAWSSLCIRHSASTLLVSGAI